MPSRARIFAGLLLAAALQAGTLAVHAEEEMASGVYLGIDGGLAWGSLDNSYDCYWYCTSAAELELDTGYAAALKVGWASGKLGIGRIRAEFEAGYRSNDAATLALYPVPPVAAHGEVTVNSYMLNVMYDFNVSKRFMPYAGGGLGMAKVDAGTICGTGASTTCMSGGSTEFAGQLILGAALNLTPKASLTADLRLLVVPNVTLNYGLNCTSSGANCSANGAEQFDYYSSVLTLGLRYIF